MAKKTRRYTANEVIQQRIFGYSTLGGGNKEKKT